MDTTFAVSSKAKAMGGSTMFLNELDRPSVRELLHGIIINSGNDACVVVAEGLAGSEEAFAAQMTGGSLASPFARLGRQGQSVAHLDAFRMRLISGLATPPGMTMTPERGPLAGMAPNASSARRR